MRFVANLALSLSWVCAIVRYTLLHARLCQEEAFVNDPEGKPLGGAGLRCDSKEAAA